MFKKDPNHDPAYRQTAALLEGLTATLQEPAIQKALGGYAVDIAQIAEASFIPNIRNGKLKMPQGYRDSDALPIFTVLPHQTVALEGDFHTPGSTQWQTIEAHLKTMFDPALYMDLREIVARTFEEAKPVTIDNPAQATSSIVQSHGFIADLKVSLPGEPTSVKRAGFRGRPTLLLLPVMQESDLAVAASAVVSMRNAGYTARNGIDKIKTPAQVYGDVLKDYYVGSMFQRAAASLAEGVYGGQALHPGVEAIEKIRARHNAKRSPFHADRSIRRLVDRSGAVVIPDNWLRSV